MNISQSQSKFIGILKNKGIAYSVNSSGEITITGGYVGLSSLKSLPEGIKFNNDTNVNLNSLESLPKDIKFNNGGNVDLYPLESLPKGVEFNNGGYIIIKKGILHSEDDYLKRHKVNISDKNTVILYKRVSKDFKTQEGELWETLWKIGSTVEHPAWNPETSECGKGKFHACAKPHWCDVFRNESDDKYIAIEIHVKDLYEWKENPNYPQKIAFRKGTVLKECERYIS